MKYARIWLEIAKNCKNLEAEETYTSSQLAQILGCSCDLINRWVREGEKGYNLSYIREGKNGRLYSGSNVLGFLSDIGVYIPSNIYTLIDNISVEDKDGAILLIPIGTKIKIIL